MEHIFSDETGVIHFIFSIIAMLAGTVVLIQPKGNLLHKKVGYVYTSSMVGLLITSFIMYNLYGSFGIFHWLAIVSTITLLGGMVPMFLKKPSAYISYHFNFMYWSVFGLYAAFMAEVLTRIPKVIAIDGVPVSVFYNMVGVAIFITMGAGYYFMNKKKKNWANFDKSQQ